MNDANYFNWKPFSNTAVNLIAGSDAWINIAVGSVRSGKTIAVLTRFIEFILTSEHSDFMMVGKTLNSLDRNVVKPLKKMLNSLGIEHQHNRYLNEVYFYDKTVSLFGVGKSGDDEKIQGSTFAGTLIDEATVIPEENFKMILSRNSLSGACIFITCNPSNPNHYLYTEYLTNQKLLENHTVKRWKFLLEDNTTLSDQYIENLKASYPEDSLFYKRYILGEWVSGQGAIYDTFTEDNIYYDGYNKEDYLWLAVGSDYGVSTTTCYTLVGKTPDGIYHVIAERYYNAETEGVSQSDKQRVNDIYHLQQDYQLDNRVTFYCSHDAGNLKMALLQDTRIQMDIDTFTPDTLECIQHISQLFYENKLQIHHSCTETIKQIQNYEWDLRASQKGIDKPVKKDDHLVDSIRAPIMTDGNNMVGGLIEL